MTKNQMQTAKEKIGPFVERAAEALVMGDLSDASAAGDLAGAFTEVAGALGEDFPRASRAARSAGELLEKMAAGGRPPSGDAVEALEGVISGLQDISERNLADDQPAFPKGFAPEAGAKADETSMASSGEAANPASAVDQEILGEYLAQQDTVVSEIEDLVLSFEHQADAQVLKALKRLLHTAKGEAGVLGLNPIERVCHRVEDYIQKDEQHLQADLLLEFKDWFEQSISALKQGQEIVSADNLLEALDTAIHSPPVSAEKDQAAKSASDPGPEPEPAPEFDHVPEPPQAPEPQTSCAEAGQDSEMALLMSAVEIEDPEITADFISEANEHFEISDENLLTLENDPENEEAIASIFRAFHTIKGTTSFLGLTPVSTLAHKAENLLDEVRKKRIAFDGQVVDATFNALDLLKKMNKDLEAALGADGMYTPPPELPDVFVQLKAALGNGDAAPKAKPAPEAAPQENKNPAPAAADPLPDTGAEAAQPAAEAAAAGGASAYAGKTVRQTMKIDADRIDLLLETIGELVIVESIVSQEAGERRTEARELERNLAQLKKITRSLQDIGMSMRLIPIDNTFRKMGRLVRDLAKKSGKKIELTMEGRETELDKGMVEKLGDPLVHMIRNAVDHGIEPTADDRVAAGKPATGTIVLKAYHQGGNIHIDITDDGRGLDREAISAKAKERGLITSDETMTDEEIFALIFEPGFSTAKQITDVSGRGVGMDVVKSNIESMRGNVRIRSQKGVGSTFTLVLPLTMAIIDGMIVRAGSERYILPLLSIIESFQPTREMITTVSGKGETVPFRQRLLPLFRLATMFDIHDAQSDPTQALVVVLEDAGRQIALLVDELLGQNQTVIKNLGQGLKHVDGIAGASIMPDGTPGLIVDVNGLVKLATA